MLTCDHNSPRSLQSQRIDADLVVVGGGMAGFCAAITAAREGIDVVLVQDRPVLGGNASSEVRLWILGATSHMGNNNRWAREGGVIDEVLVENIYRNPEGNSVIFDTILLEKAALQPRLKLLLNTAVHDLQQDDQRRIQSARAFCSQNSTQYDLRAPLFCDASGDGIVGFLAGAAFRIGAESRAEFGELLAPVEEHRNLLGHSIYFYTRDTGRPVRFTAPSYALDDITKIPHYRSFNTNEHGCQLWWIEYGGSRDTVHDTEEIKWELWKVVYGVWNHIKNSGEFPKAETLTLEWVGQIPGKRESRRFEGEYMLVQQDIVDQRTHYDAVSYGGWAIDLHPVDAIYSAESPCTQWHAKGVYQIPYRTMISPNVPNLFLAGRIISASHIAFGSTRVMATCAHNAQVVGAAAALCRRRELLPADVALPDRIGALQSRLLRRGQFIPGIDRHDPNDLAQRAHLSASSEYQLQELRPAGDPVALTDSRGMLLPVAAGPMPSITLQVETEIDTDLVVELRTSSSLGGFTPDVLLQRQSTQLRTAATAAQSAAGDATGVRSAAATRDGGGAVVMQRATPAGGKRARSSPQKLTINFQVNITVPSYVMICLQANPNVTVRQTDQRITGVLVLAQRHNKHVAKGSRQDPPVGIGIDQFEFWTPERRPQGRNLAITAEPSIARFGPKNVTNGIARPTTQPNAWVAADGDPQPTLELRWDEPQVIRQIEISFDTDFDYAMESVLLGHAERVMPFCVRNYRIRGAGDQLLVERRDNYQTRNIVQLDPPVTTDVLKIEADAPSDNIPAAIFEVRCY